MTSISPCSLHKYLKIVPAQFSDYEELARFHYQSPAVGPIRGIYKLIDDHLWRRLAAPVVGIIVYGAPSANLAVRNAATGGMFSGLDRSAALSLLNQHMSCIRRVIIEPRYRGLGLASRLVAETLPLAGTPMVEAVSVMGRVHPFFQRAGMKEYRPRPDAKTERMAAAMEVVGIPRQFWSDPSRAHRQLCQLTHPQQSFIDDQMQRFLQKFATQRNMAHSPERTAFVLSKLIARGVYYLWHNGNF